MHNLYRSRQNRMIAGVAGGMAEYAQMDVAIMRLIWVMAFFAGIGFIAYIICWIIIPEKIVEEGIYSSDNSETMLAPDIMEQKAARRRNVGLFLVGLGFVFLIKNFIPWHYWDKVWPLLLVVLGLYILFANNKGD